MIRVRGIKINYKLDNESEILKKVSKKLNINEQDIILYKINKKSLDARDNNNLHYVYELDLYCNNEKEILKRNKDVFETPDETYKVEITGTKTMKHRPVIVGSGPAGLFAAYILIENGFKPIIIERGQKIEDRTKTVNEFWETGKLNPNSNVQFGEGGAGTFSDGKLNTLVKDKKFRMKKVFDTFVLNGAPEEILYINKPHIGTDALCKVITNMRNRIIEKGGEFRYNTILTDLIIKDDKLEEIVINNNETIPCDNLILAIGHSARDTFEMLYNRNLNMEVKPFAIGLRVQHKQEMINLSQYSTNDITATYKLTYNSNGRGVYTFCMCPGGYVINASSEEGHLAINGMSYHKRDAENANSAVIVTVGPEDFGNHPLDGIKFQKDLEKKAYELCKGKIPVQLYGDFTKQKVSKEFGSVKPCFKGEYEFADLNKILPYFITLNFKEGMNAFGKKIKGFAKEDTILAGIESRTSSPVKIIRDETCMSNIKGIYPCGEGAGYAGGITTSAMDGIKVAEAIMSIYKN